MKLEGSQLVLDTNVLIHLIRGGVAGIALDQAYDIRGRRPRPIVPIVVKGEIKAFAHHRGWGTTKLNAIEAVLAELPAADIGADPVLDAYARLDSESRRLSRKMGKNDLWIAALAQVASAVVLTTDRDFEHLHPALVSVEYVDPERLKVGQV